MDSIFSPEFFEVTSCGEDLEYASAYVEFMTLAAPSEERQVGAHVIPAATPDWASVLKTGCSLLKQSRDLRILAKICRAAIHQYGLTGLDQTMALMACWMENQWDDLHPRLTIDGEFDPLLRSNAISDIADPAGVVRFLRQAIFIELPVGAVAVSAADQLLSGMQVAEQEIVSTIEQLTQVIAGEEEKNRDRFAALASIQVSLDRIVSIFRSRLDSEYWPNIDLLTGIVSRLNHFITTTLSETAPELLQQPVTTEGSESVDSQASAPAGSGGLPAKLQTRAEAFRALSLARKYFENNEPSHPAPLLIQRIERLASMDFSQIIRELTPEGVKQLQLLAGNLGDGTP
ncbi:MAG: type VI secretion system protein TssA [Betaproteobacteria bacterium]|nr:type VI secretion system protein TssA [Betaproteobacteria bacterium]